MTRPLTGTSFGPPPHPATITASKPNTPSPAIRCMTFSTISTQSLSQKPLSPVLGGEGSLWDSLSVLEVDHLAIAWTNHSPQHGIETRIRIGQRIGQQMDAAVAEQELHAARPRRSPVTATTITVGIIGKRIATLRIGDEIAKVGRVVIHAQAAACGAARAAQDNRFIPVPTAGGDGVQVHRFLTDKNGIGYTVGDRLQLGSLSGRTVAGVDDLIVGGIVGMSPGIPSGADVIPTRKHRVVGGRVRRDGETPAGVVVNLDGDVVSLRAESVVLLDEGQDGIGVGTGGIVARSIGIAPTPRPSAGPPRAEGANPLRSAGGRRTNLL